MGRRWENGEGPPERWRHDYQWGNHWVEYTADRKWYEKDDGCYIRWDVDGCWIMHDIREGMRYHDEREVVYEVKSSAAAPPTTGWEVYSYPLPEVYSYGRARPRAPAPTLRVVS